MQLDLWDFKPDKQGFKEWKANFKWQDKEISQITTSHLTFILCMLFNHFTLQYPILKPVFEDFKRYQHYENLKEPEWFVETMIYIILELDVRKKEDGSIWSPILHKYFKDIKIQLNRLVKGESNGENK